MLLFLPLVSALPVLDSRYAPRFHVSPARCHPETRGWTNDPNGPFEFNGVHHLFYQSAPLHGTSGPGPGGRLISWGHVAGNLSHWQCLPPAIRPGMDSDGSSTPYDSRGIFTGSVTVVNGTPIATYPGEPGDQMCQAYAANLSDPVLTQWRKSSLNPLHRGTGSPQDPTTTGPLGCTSSWREAGNWTTTIQSRRAMARRGCAQRSGPAIIT